MTGDWVRGEFESWDGTKMFYRFFRCAKARHTVLLIHGFGEHSGRYEKFPERMPRLGVQWAIMDLRGMGQSGGARGDVSSFEDYLKDLDAFWGHLQRQHDLPDKCILLGHSFGGLLAIYWAMICPERIKRLILSVPFLGFRWQPLIGILNGFIHAVRRKFVFRNPIFPKSLTHNSEEISAYRKDSWIVRQISSHLVKEMMQRMIMLRRLPVVSFPFTVTVFAAGQERVVASKAIRSFFQRMVVPHKEYFVFDGFYHEIFNETEQQKVFNVLKTILEDCV